MVRALVVAEVLVFFYISIELKRLDPISNLKIADKSVVKCIFRFNQYNPS